MNTYDMFVGRKLEIEEATRHLVPLGKANADAPPRAVMLHGIGGIGKTKLTTELVRRLRQQDIFSTSVIDVKESKNRTLLSLLRTLADEIAPSLFSEFLDFVQRYEESGDADRNKYHRLAVEAFLRGMKTATTDSPVVIALDTLESIQGTRFLETVLSLLPQFGGKCGFILAGRHDLPLSPQMPKTAFKVSGFLARDIELMARRMFTIRGTTCVLAASVFDRLLRATQGKPILCGLAIDWLLENPDQTEYIVGLPTDTFEREIILCLKGLDRGEADFIELMAVAVKRFDVGLAAVLSGKSEAECAETFKRLKRFSFVRELPGECLIALHDEVVRLINDNYVPQKTRDLLDGILRYYDTQMSHANACTTRHNGLLAESLYYRMLADRQMGLQYFDTVAHSALESFDHDLCTLLLNEMAVFSNSNDARRLTELCKAELLLAQYKPMDAKRVLDGLSIETEVKGNDEFSARVFEGYGNTIINACTIVGADLFQAVDYLKRSRDIYVANGDETRLAQCLLALGKAYVYIGRHVDAENAFREALQHSKARGSHKLSAKILDEMGKMYRLQQSVEQSLAPLEESHRIRTEHKDEKNLGVYYYYLANTYRDLDRFEDADRFYEVAERCLADVDDSFRLCELYCDMSWRRCLSGDYNLGEQLVEKAWDLAQGHGFGTEYSEYFHIRYEIAIGRGETSRAYEFLDQALQYARKFSNIYIILDCLNHSAQKAYAQGTVALIPEIITEMKRYEGLGCGIKVFTGRAIVVQGDVHYDKQEYDSAFLCWKEGLTTIALYGNSRSNMELFDDILAARRDKLGQALKSLGEQTRRAFADHWQREGLSQHFPQVLDICCEGQKG